MSIEKNNKRTKEQEQKNNKISKNQQKYIQNERYQKNIFSSIKNVLHMFALKTENIYCSAKL